MENFQALFLGILQGLTEFLPVSSSGHLVIAQHFIKFASASLFFDIMLHIATLFAVFIYFRKECAELLKAPFSPLGLLLIVATIPTGLIGFFGQEHFKVLFASPNVIPVTLVINGAILFTISLLASKNSIEGQAFELTKNNILKALLIGIAQGIAITPGISRAGMTISSALLCGFSLSQAFSFSFLLSIPAIIGAFILEFEGINNLSSYTPLIVGFAAAFVSGLAALYILRRLLWSGYLSLFGYYCVIMGGFFYFML